MLKAEGGACDVYSQLAVDIKWWTVLTGLPTGHTTLLQRESTSLTLIQRRSNVMCPLGTAKLGRPVMPELNVCELQ